MNQKLTFLLGIMVFLPVSLLFAQTDKGFSYQAIARDNSGTILSGSPVNLRFQIREGAPGGPVSYQETHSLTTNTYGLISTTIGKGNSEIGDFQTIPWSSDDYYLVVELNGAGVDTSLLEGVPYSMVATDMSIDDLTDVNISSPASGQVLKWNGSEWTPASDDGGTSYSAGSGISITGGVIENTAPDQVVTLNGSGATSVSGSYPNFTISSTDDVNDADANPANEIQTLSLSGNTLSLSTGGGSVNLSPIASPWSSSGSNVFYNSGNVGIGDNSPTATLTVGNGDKLRIFGADGDIRFNDDQGSIRFASSTGTNAPMMYMFNSGTNNSTRMLVAHSPNFSSWGLRYNDTADAFTWIGNNLPVMHMQLSGQRRIGVGLENPTAKVQVNHNSNLTDPQLLLFEEGNDYARLSFANDQNSRYWSIAGLNTSSVLNDRLNFFNSSIGDVMSLAGSGRVGIRIINPTARLHLFQGGQSVGTGLRFTDGTANQDWDITHGFSLRFHYGGTLRGFINANTGAYTQGSDARLKQDATDMTAVLPRVTQLRALRYRYLNTPQEAETIGFFAQEVLPVFPELVSFSEADDFYGINYAGFSVVAIKAIQEQQEIIEDQQAEIDDLKTRLAKIEAMMASQD